MKLNLKGKVMIPAILLVLVGMGVSAAISYRVSAAAFKDQVTQQIDQITDSAVKQLGDWIKTLRRDLTNWSQSKIFQSAFQTGFLGKSARKSADEYLEQLRQDNEYYESISLVDPQGVVVASSNPDMIDQSQADQAFFKGAMAGRSQISDVSLNPSSGAPGFVLAGPVIQENQVIGVLFTRVDLGNFNKEKLDVVKIGQSGYAYLLDPEGMVIAHPDKSLILKLDITQYDFGKNIMKEKNGIITYTWKGDEKIVSFRQDPDTGWIVAAGAQSNEMLAAARRLGFINLWVALGMVVFLSLALTYLIHVLISRPLSKAKGVLGQLAKGDLSQRMHLKSRDEVGEISTAVDLLSESLSDFTGSLKQIGEGDLTMEMKIRSPEDQITPVVISMVENLRLLVREVNEAAFQIDSGAGQVKESSQALSQGATEQAASLEEITSSMNEIGSQTKINAENAVQANGLAQDARDAAEKGNREVQEMNEAMGEINQAGQEIAKIIKTIDDIAFQTNLLALNAAVEAARAGHHGKGFAVVAQEVRNLAGRSARAAQETGELIEGSVKKVEAGNEIASRTFSALSAIVDGSTKSADLVGEIAAASTEQAQGVAQINQGLTQIEKVTQLNTANAEETAAAAMELSDQARKLREVLGRFRMEHGEGPRRKTVSRAREHQAERPGPPRHITPPRPKPLPRSEDGWGEAGAQVNPEDIIALDDDNFGKY